MPGRKAKKTSEKIQEKIAKNKGENGDGKKAAIDAVTAQLEKQFGAGVIQSLKGNTVYDPGSVISTGSLGFDYICGTNGLRKGRIVEIYGAESAGKTTLVMHIVAEVQSKGGTVLFIDAENSFDPEYAKNIGVDADSLIFSQPNSAQEAYTAIENFVRFVGVDLVIVDSLAALVPQEELDKSSGEYTMGLQAKLTSEICRKMSTVLNKTDTVLIFTNQLRQKIGGYGNPETTPGGMAVKFYASYRFDVRRTETLKHGADGYGIRTKIKCVKNKCSKPFKATEVDIIWGKGVVREAEIIDYAAKLGLVEKNGPWYSYQGEKIGQGKESACEWLREHGEKRDELENKIRELYS